MSDSLEITCSLENNLEITCLLCSPEGYLIDQNGEYQLDQDGNLQLDQG